MIKAEKLDYDTVMGALEKGDFYATTGPDITELYWEDNILHVTCSEAVTVALVTERRRNQQKNAAPGELLTAAEFDLMVDRRKLRRRRHPVFPHSGKRRPR